MISQNDGRMRLEIQKFGCYYMDLVWIANHYTNLSVSAEMINNGLYTLFRKREWMTDTCWIKNPVKMLDWMGVPVKSVIKTGPDYACKRGEIVVGFWKRSQDIGHFVVMDGSCVAYDPWFSPEGGSLSVREGKLESLRVFRRYEWSPAHDSGQ